MSSVSDKLYHYRAELLRIIDGDTLEVRIDHGFDSIKSTRRLRLLGVDTPERGHKEFESATKQLTDLVGNRDLIVHTIKRDSFGRWLAVVWANNENVNHAMMANGWSLYPATPH